MSVLSEALDYAKRGWLTVPLHNPKQGVCSCRKKACGSPGKHPRTAHGLKDASKDAAQIKSWWQQWPEANVGIVTGRESGLLVLDVDGEDGKASLQALIEEHGSLPKTLCALTGRMGRDDKRNGCHYYFRAPAGATIRNSASVLGKGLDIRAEGGYVVAPPSLHPSGRLYEWLAPGIVPGQPLADAPAWMLAKLADGKPAQQQTAPAQQGTQTASIGEGGRNHALASLGGAMRRKGMTPAAIEAALLAENAARCTPPLPDAEVREIARSVSRYEPAETGRTIQARPTEQPTAPAPEQQKRQWPAPMGEAAYYGLAGEFVRTIAPHTEADPAALLVQVLVALGSIIGRGPHYRAGADKHHANLFAVIVGNSSKARKGTSWGEVNRVAGITDLHWSKTRISSGLSTGEGLIHAVRDSITESVPIKEKGRVIDTQEQVTDAGETDKRLLCVEGELGQTLQCAAREGSTLSAVVRQAWDGVPLRVLAKSAKATCLEPHISVIGHITITELQRLLTASDVANGFANRFLWVCSARSQCLPFGGTADPEALSATGARARAAVEVAKGISEVTWAAETRALWAEVYGQLSEGKPGLLGSIVARAEAQTVRLAMLYALLDCSAEIRLDHLKAALELWRYSEDSAAYIFGQSVGDPTADAIVQLLRERPEGVTRKELSDHFDRNKTKAELDAALTLAQSSGLIRVARRETGGRPAEVWLLVSV
ncbi:MAG: DUF3987 domain-containing protein [Acidobacteria bacterium]|nr:DUF3987 domain-containing protein [Acidobacteriota bacterium]